MAVELITKEDLHNFKTELITELKEMLTSAPVKPKEYLKSTEVKKLLDISAGTLQHLRVIGSLPYTKVGGTLFYKHQDVIQMLEANNKNQASK